MSLKSFLNWFENDKGPDKEGARKRDKEIDWTEKRRDNRIDLNEAKPLTVNLMVTEVGDKARTLTAVIRNISVRGCHLAFASQDERSGIEPKQILVASLAVDDFSIPLQVEVVRLIGATGAAIRFKPPFPRELEKLEKFLEPRCLGRSLREIDQAKLQKGPQKGVRWFQGVNETHLFSWVDPKTNEVTQQQLVFLDRVVEWSQAGVRTGLIRQDQRSQEGDIGWVKSEVMDLDRTPDAAVLQQAKTVIDSSVIDGAIKKVFISKISKTV